MQPVGQLVLGKDRVCSLMISDGRRDHRDSEGRPVFADDTSSSACAFPEPTQLTLSTHNDIADEGD